MDKLIRVDGELRRLIDCPGALPGCEVLHTAPVTDTDRLDWLQSQTTGYGNGWLARLSSWGRGFRLCETSRPEARPTVREAIDAAVIGETIQ